MKNYKVLNYHFCLCEDEWREAIEEYDLLETALYLPLAFGFETSENNCDKADVFFMEMAEFSGKSSEYIEHLKGIWGNKEGFENALYNYRITIRLLENIVLPKRLLRRRKFSKNSQGRRWPNTIQTLGYLRR